MKKGRLEMKRGMKVGALVLFLCFVLCGCEKYYYDADGDGYGDPDIFVEKNVQPDGYVLDNTDCDDSVSRIYPGAPEYLDGIDNQCPGDAGYGQIDEPTARDLTDFNEFRYHAGRGVGFCPTLDSVYTATISKNEDGSCAIEMSIVVLRQDAPEGCPGIREFEDPLVAGDDECLELIEFPIRSLTESEVQKMEAVFGSIEIKYNPVGCVDPCLVHAIAWDSYAVSTPIGCLNTYVETVDKETEKEIIAFLNSLRQVEDN
jgi:hypothetical protein